MKRLLFGQLLVLFTISASLAASEIGTKLKQSAAGLNPANCSGVMNSIEILLDDYQVEDYQREIARESHAAILQELWSVKINLHEKLRQFHLQPGLFKECADAARGAFKTLRTFEDHIGEHYYRTHKEVVKFPDNAFEMLNLHVRRHPQFTNFNMLKDLRSGDILLTRGNAYTSAAIASLGEFDTQFSHMSMVYKDPQGKIWTVEAHIEVGSFVRTLEEHIDDKNFRTMVYRMNDEEVAKRAAEFIFHKVKRASDTTGNINYDFGFEQDDSSALFCSEVVSHAIDQVTNGGVAIPMFRSSLLKRKPEFVKMLGITAAESFVPADIEVDPRFKVIAEWRDSSRTNNNLQKDAVLHAMYRWNDEFGYQMRQASSKTSLLYRNVAWPLRRVPYLKKYFVNKMPLNMSRQLIGYFGVLESTGELLQKELKAFDDKSIRERGFPLLSKEKYEVLEAYRLQDLTASKKKLHRMYRPKSKG